MKIGIGITTFHRPECLNLFLTQLANNPPASECVVHIASDIPSIAAAKNQCLNVLFNEDCDFIFLFDDDCFPIVKHWDLPFIKSGYGHLLYMNDSYQPVQKLDDVTRYQDCAGCFMFLTKDVVKNVGYFNSEYGKYGFEHMGYSHRIKRFTNDWAYLCLNETPKLIHSLDLDGTNGFKVHHNKTSPEERVALTNLNKHIYEQEINSDQIHYEY